MRCLATLVFFGCCLALASPGLRADDCSVAADHLSFGEYRPLESKHLDSLATIRVTCDGPKGKVVFYRLRLNQGASGSFYPRAMIQGPDQLRYNLFRNASRSRIWGDGSLGTGIIAGSFTLLGNGDFVSRIHVVFARLFARQSVRPGGYSDVIHVTLETCDEPQQCQIIVVPLSIS